VGLTEAVFHLVASDGDPLLATAVGTKIFVMDASISIHFVKTESLEGDDHFFARQQSPCTVGH
jgi:hypothetical protein